MVVTSGFLDDAPTLPLINERDKLNLSPDELKSLLHDAGDRKGMSVVSSADNGKTFHVVGMARFPEKEIATEHMVVERRDEPLDVSSYTERNCVFSLYRQWENVECAGTLRHPASPNAFLHWKATFRKPVAGTK